MIRTMLSEITYKGVEDAAYDLGIETQQYIDLFAVFITRINNSIEELSDFLSQKDTEAALRSLHSTKGTSQNMRLNMIAQPAIHIENLLRNDHLDEAIEAYPKLRKALVLLIEQAKSEGILPKSEQ